VNRDPIGEKGGNNLYVIVNNGPLVGVDYLGMDCIVVSDRAVARSRLLYHYALEKLIGCCPPENVEKRYRDYVPTKLHSVAKVELLNIVSFKVEQYATWVVPSPSPFGSPSAYVGWNTVSLGYPDSGISVIHYNFNAPDTVSFANVYDASTHTDMAGKWAEILSAARNYEYAAQGLSDGNRIEAEVLLGRTTNFPKSRYRSRGNNSNVFARNMLKQVGIPMFELSRLHPPEGRDTPDPSDNDYDPAHYRNLRLP
jgi:hypothetical protein